MRYLRGCIAGLLGGVAWRFGLMFIFGPAQALLADPNRQSSKLLRAFSLEAPVPRTYESPWIIWAGLLLIGMLWGLAYVIVPADSARTWWVSGLRFGVVSWLLMVPWFEFYLPWNVLREPALLVVLECLCWAGVLLEVGLTIAAADTTLRRFGMGD